jgi:CubicO group peptidase (beta-lactamase class C family)
MYTSMQDQHVAGAVLSVVADGELIFSKGYGYSNVQKQLLVDPEQTLIRIASITKLLSWTALMQLHEQGRLELDKDINQ